ncbi:hypothetical protein D3C81_716150 [compost metagenome]
MHESLLLGIEQVGITVFDPQQYLAEVMQVVERVVDGMGDHRAGSGSRNGHCLYIQITPAGKPRGSGRQTTDQWRLSPVRAP